MHKFTCAGCVCVDLCGRNHQDPPIPPTRPRPSITQRRHSPRLHNHTHIIVVLYPSDEAKHITYTHTKPHASLSYDIHLTETSTSHTYTHARRCFKALENVVALRLKLGEHECVLSIFGSACRGLCGVSILLSCPLSGVVGDPPP